MAERVLEVVEFKGYMHYRKNDNDNIKIKQFKLKFLALKQQVEQTIPNYHHYTLNKEDNTDSFTFILED